MAAAIGRLCRSQRSMMFCPKRCSSVVAANAATINEERCENLYPPIKPKYPPGRWGSMDPGYAWLWHQWREESMAIEDPRERIAALCEKEMTQLKYSAKFYRPRLLPYHQYITKTHLISGLPQLYSKLLVPETIDSLTASLTSVICDIIVIETELLERRRYLAQFPSYLHSMKISQFLVRSILQTLITRLGEHFPHLRTIQIDEDARIQAFWDRHGIKRMRRRFHPRIYQWCPVYDRRITSSTIADFVLRATKPLPEFVDRDEAPCVGGRIPELDFDPVVYGQQLERKGKRSIMAGHVWGDPCEFGLLSIHDTDWTQKAADQFGADHALNMRTGQALGASFLWLVAQAHNQGFNTYIDLTYPLSTQTIVTDGHRWQFVAYQLNTLALWLDSKANDRANVCWVGDESELYATVEGGQVRGFNPSVLRQLISCLALAPADRPYNLRPTLSPTSLNPQLKEEFIPLKKEEVKVVYEEKYVD